MRDTRRPLQPAATLLAVLTAALLAGLVAPGSAPPARAAPHAQAAADPAAAAAPAAGPAAAAGVTSGTAGATAAPPAPAAAPSPAAGGSATAEGAAAGPTAAEGPTAQPVQDSDAFPVYSARDPFDQLVVDTGAGDGATVPAEGVPPADPAGGTGSTDTGGTSAGGTAIDGTSTDGTSTDGTSTGGTSTDPGTAPSPSSSPAPRSTATGTGGRRIELVDVYTAPAGGLAAVVIVNGSGYTPAVGDTFAGDIVLVSAEDRCVALRVDGAAVGLCEGDAVRK